MFFPIICPRRRALLDCAHQRSGPAQPITAPQTEIPMRNCHCSRSQLGSGVAHGRYHQAHPTLAIGHPQTEQPAVHPLVIPLSLSPTTTAAQTNITAVPAVRRKRKKITRSHLRVSLLIRPEQPPQPRRRLTSSRHNWDGYQILRSAGTIHSA